MFENRVTEPTKTIEQVSRAGSWSKKAIVATTRPSRNAAVDQQVLERTLEEVQEGKAIGPLEESEVDGLLGKCWAPARRVGLEQAARIRPIDVFTEYGLN